VNYNVELDNPLNLWFILPSNITQKPFIIKPISSLLIPNTFDPPMTTKLKPTLLFILLFVTGFLSLRAQQYPGGNRGMNGNGQKMPAIGRVYGKVMESNSRNAIEYATVTLHNQKDSLISGGLTRANGDFSLEKLPFGRYKLKVQFMGFKSLIIPVVINLNNVEQDIGNISLQADAKTLKEAVISEQRPAVIIGVDRRIYNVEKDLSSSGGTAVDVMKNIPGLTVDADGNVSLRNQSPTIFIDGRPTTLTMEQLPSDQIDRIEVITNPSAKFDAGATGGIVNVVLKKNNKPGYNGMIGANIGTISFDELNRYNVNGNLNIKEGKTNFFISYNLNYNNNPTLGYTTRTSLLNGAETGTYHQDNRNTSTRMMQHIRFGFDFTLSNRNTLTFSQGFMKGGFDNDELQTFSQTSYRSLLYQGTRTNEQSNQMQFARSQIMWKHTFPKQDKELTADFTYNRRNHTATSLFTTHNYDASNVLFSNNPQWQQNEGSGSGDVFTFQSDYTNPITDTARIEFGVKSNYSINRSGLDVMQKTGNPDNAFAPDTFLTTHYAIYDIINAAYINYTNMIWGIGYQAGLRFEQTHFTGDLNRLGSQERFEYIYPNLSNNIAKAIFPSIFLSKKLNEKNEVQANFSRKINRPGWMQVVPFIMFSDRNNFQIGNPALAPEFINMVELNYNLIFGSGNWLTSGYTRFQENPITPYVYRSSTDSSILISTFINGESNIAYGWENTFKLTLLNRKLDFSFNANIFHTTINATASGTNLINSGISWNMKSMISYRLPKQFNIQLNGSYDAPRIIAQGKTKEVYSIDFSVSKEVTKKLTFNFTINDIFNTRGFGTYYTTEFFTQELWRRRDTRFFRLGFTYRFGEWDVSLFKRKPAKRGNEAQPDMGEF
jgi:outer membrane cobalamin receptor